MKTFSTKKTSEIKTDFELPFVLFDEINNITQKEETIENTNNDASIISKC